MSFQVLVVQLCHAYLGIEVPKLYSLCRTCNQLHEINTAGSTGAGIPKPVIKVNASMSNASVGSTSIINILFQRDPSDKNFARVVILAKGYQGNNSPVQVGSGADSPCTVILNNTGESVTLIVQSVGNGGVSPIASSPTCSIKLPKNSTGGFGTQTTTNITSTQVQSIASGATVGSRASLPSTSTKGSIYLCTDAEYEYFSDGSNWTTRVNGFQGIDPGVDTSFVLKHTAAPSGSSIDTSKGGMKINVGSAAGDHVEGYLKPVSGLSASSAFAIGFNNTYGGALSQGGIVCYNSVTGKWNFFRYAGGQMYCSQYLDGTGWVANPTSNTWPNVSFPRRGVWGVTFPTAGSVTVKFYMDSELTSADGSGVNLTDSYSGGAAGITHIGVGANLGSSVWSQYFKQVR